MTQRNEANRQWHEIDAKDQILGRLSTKVANLLRGKEKTTFAPNIDIGDYVVVINAKDIRVTGKKMEQKIYYRHTGYPGGLKQKTLKELKKGKPEDVIRKAVSGMLPKNKLRNLWLKRLYIYQNEEHPYKNKVENKK